MADDIFMIREGGVGDSSDRLTVLKPSNYESEAVLQIALEDHPEVLAGVDSGHHQKPLLLVRREKGIPIESHGIDWFSVDHLFVDSEGVPVVVEVKRSSDTRIRREVVGQMLDYAANGLKYWPVAELRADLEETCGGSENAAAAVESVASGASVEEFWGRVEANLRSGRVRLVFVADHLPDQLVRVIEFLNEQMSPAEVLGVEVPLYESEGVRVLVPRIVGATTAAGAAKSRTGKTSWDRESLLEEVAAAHPSSVSKAEAVLDHAEAKGAKLSWGSGRTAGVSCWYEVAGTPRPVWYLWAGSGEEGRVPELQLWGNLLLERIGESANAEFLAGLSTVSSFAELLEGGQVEPRVKLPELSDGDLVSVLTETELLADVDVG